VAVLLLIEDNRSLREATARLLEVEGYTVVTAEGGAEAWALLENGLRPGAIVLDLTLPDMDGFQFREQQLENSQLATIPVVIWSGRALSPNDLALLRGAAVLVKPSHAAAVLRTIQAVCPLDA